MGNNYLYAISFKVGGDTGIAIIIARSDYEAMGLLRNTGKFNCTPEVYSVIECRNLGFTTSFRAELLLESYVNAQGALDAFMNEVQKYIGPKGPKGDKGDKGDKGEPGEAPIYYNTTSYWNSQIGYIPKAGDIIVYSDYRQLEVGGFTVNVPGIKVGSGNAYVQDLTFTDAFIQAELLAHAHDDIIHITGNERMFWNNKLNVDDNQEVVGESLIFNRN